MFLILTVCFISASVPQLNSPTSYATLGRPSSLPLSKQNYQRSTSNPNLLGITPTSPDAEVMAFMGMLFCVSIYGLYEGYL